MAEEQIDKGNHDSATDSANAAEPTKDKQQGKSKSKTLSIGLLGIAAVVIGAIGYGLYSSDGQFLLQLQKTDVSRGLITFLVAVITVAIALSLVIWVLVSNLDNEDLKIRFASAKEILSTLVGILGTILGFYFGSVDSEGERQLLLSELKFKNNEIVVSASGGTAPYRFTTNLPEDASKQVRVSQDGWLFAPLPDNLKAGTSVTVTVTDSRDKSVSRTSEYSESTPSPSDANGGE
jgi:hypothetical protein